LVTLLIWKIKGEHESQRRHIKITERVGGDGENPQERLLGVRGRKKNKKLREVS